MDDEKWPSLPQDPSWVLEQIEMGARQAGVPFEAPPAVPRRSPAEIESVVTKLLQEELERLEAEKEPQKR
ncbi:MAG TPA: hypothetical protein VH394_06510 [Thermoanaerobaculia bacterium]|jgi:hypothetical protein|nr:hypothetical protein [Thermoanaerobaculia bacterium]